MDLHEVKAKGIVALRSGEYTQCRGSIGSVAEKNLCCIGVWAHALAPQTPHFSTTEHALEILEQHGIPVFKDTGEHSPFTEKLIDMNDEEDKNFLEIADYIEANL